MGALNDISKMDLKELLNLGWMTHDGMWFYHCFQELGIQATNKLNRSAIAALAMFEVPRIKKAMDLPDDFTPKTVEEVRVFMEGAMELIMPQFMRFEYEFRPPDRFWWKWEQNQCFAYKGVRRMGVLDDYHCGVMWRIDKWFEVLGVPFTGPEVTHCLMHTRGSCEGEYTFHLPA